MLPRPMLPASLKQIQTRALPNVKQRPVLMTSLLRVGGGNRKKTAYAKRQDGLDGKQVSDGGIKGDPKAKRPRSKPIQSGKAKGRPGMSPQEIKKMQDQNRSLQKSQAKLKEENKKLKADFEAAEKRAKDAIAAMEATERKCKKN